MSRVLVAALVITLGVAAQTARAQDAPRTAAAAAGAPLNLNSASVAQLETLPGIGRAVAERIVEYRQKNGSIAQLSVTSNPQTVEATPPLPSSRARHPSPPALRRGSLPAT